MENFTDLFGDDLTGLDGLGELGNFGGTNTGAPGGPPANAPPGQPGPPTSESASMPTPSMDPYSQYPPQPGAGGPSSGPGDPSGMNNYGQFRGMTPTSAGHFQGYQGQYPSQNMPPRAPANYPSQMSAGGYAGYPHAGGQPHPNMYGRSQQQQHTPSAGWNQQTPNPYQFRYLENIV